MVVCSKHIDVSAGLLKKTQVISLLGMVLLKSKQG